MPKPDRSLESAERLFESVREMLRRSPDLRVGQILGNALAAAGYANEDVHQGLFYKENDALATLIKEWPSKVKLWTPQPKGP